MRRSVANESSAIYTIFSSLAASFERRLLEAEDGGGDERPRKRRPRWPVPVPASVCEGKRGGSTFSIQQDSTEHAKWDETPRDTVEMAVRRKRAKVESERQRWTTADVARNPPL